MRADALTVAWEMVSIPFLTAHFRLCHTLRILQSKANTVDSVCGSAGARGYTVFHVTASTEQSHPTPPNHANQNILVAFHWPRWKVIQGKRGQACSLRHSLGSEDGKPQKQWASDRGRMSACTVFIRGHIPTQALCGSFRDQVCASTQTCIDS